MPLKWVMSHSGGLQLVKKLRGGEKPTPELLEGKDKALKTSVRRGPPALGA